MPSRERPTARPVILIAMPLPGTVRLIMLPQPLSSSAMAMIDNIRIHNLVFQIKKYRHRCRYFPLRTAYFVFSASGLSANC